MARYGTGRYANAWIPDHVTITADNQGRWWVDEGSERNWYGDEFTAVTLAQGIECLPNCSCECKHGTKSHQPCEACAEEAYFDSFDR